jgi:hypothetical protein
MKPDWKDAPDWANWLAMDADGTWVWFAARPEWSDWEDEWIIPDEENDERYEAVSDSGRIDPAKSLACRPKPTPAQPGSEG